jgi:hypothetical protein
MAGLCVLTKKNGFRRRKLHGESASAPLETLPQERERLRRILRRYNLDDIYNADETGLFFRMSPNETLAQGPVNGTKKVIHSRFTFLFFLFRFWLF